MVLGQLVLGLGLGIGVGLLFELREYIIDLGILMGMILCYKPLKNQGTIRFGEGIKILVMT